MLNLNLWYISWLWGAIVEVHFSHGITTCLEDSKLLAPNPFLSSYSLSKPFNLLVKKYSYVWETKHSNIYEELEYLNNLITISTNTNVIFQFIFFHFVKKKYINK